MKTAHHVPLLLLAALAAGCARTAADRATTPGSDERPAAPASGEVGRAEPMTTPSATATPESGATPSATATPEPSATAEPPALTITTVYVEPTLAGTCGLEMPPKAYFEFDSAQLDSADHRVLREVANCLKTGPLADRKVELVGHTDPRGPDEYNKQLGRSRAQSVQEFLQQQGVAQDRLVVRSAGEQGAEMGQQGAEMGQQGAGMGQQGAGAGQQGGWQLERRVDLRLVPTP